MRERVLRRMGGRYAYAAKLIFVSDLRNVFETGEGEECGGGGGGGGKNLSGG